MTKMRPLIAMLALLLGAASTAPTPAQVTSTQEIRGLEISSSYKGFQNPRDMEELTQSILRGQFNMIIPEVRTMIGVAYSSRIEGSLPYVDETNPNPVAQLHGVIQLTRLREIENGQRVSLVDLMPLVRTLPAHNSLMGSVYPERSPLGTAPGMACLNAEGDTQAPGGFVYLDPGNPAVQQYLGAVFLELNVNMNIDGVILDDLRYPGRDWGYSPEAIAAFRAQVGGFGPPPPDDPVFSAWRREQLSLLLRSIKTELTRQVPTLKMGIVIEADGPPPTTWEEWVNSKAYAEHYQDWIGWCREGYVNLVLLRISRRHDANTVTFIDEWTRFLNNNCYNATPVISIDGSVNFTDALSTQYRAVRNRGFGTSLFHYAAPSRDQNPGFYASLQNTLFSTSLGVRLAPVPLSGNLESRQFSIMDTPPTTWVSGAAAAAAARPTPTPLVIRGATPSPVPPVATPAVIRPEQITRSIELTNGRKIEGKILEVRESSYILLPDGGSQVELPKSLVKAIIPPL